MQSQPLDREFATRVVFSLFTHEDARGRHLKAPCLQERGAYLSQLLTAGCKRRFVSERASTLLQVLRLFAEHQGRITESVIEQTSATWAVERSSPNSQKVKANIKAAARSWFRYLKRYDRGTDHRFASVLEEFGSALNRNQGYPPTTTSSCISAVSRFLLSVANEHESLSTIRIRDIVAYLEEHTENGWSRRTAINEARSLRTFFRYAEAVGLSTANISRTLRFVPSARPKVVESPSWTAVRKMLSALDCAKPSHCRARAVLLLASMYGLRRAEIVRLSLDDIDWREGTLTVQRAKRGRLQQFPLQPEVREALSRYISDIRPLSNNRTVFLTLQAPYRAATNLGSAMRKVMASLQVFSREWGLHSLRHACATELLRRGTPLRRIAEFLGHRGMGSVSIYAHQDSKGLRRVANIDLAGAL